MQNMKLENVNYFNDEICCYVDKGYTFKDKTITAGYTGKRSGFSVRIVNKLLYNTGGSESKVIIETQRTKSTKILYITTKRVIFTSEKDSFDKTFYKITSTQKQKIDC